MTTRLQERRSLLILPLVILLGILWPSPTSAQTTKVNPNQIGSGTTSGNIVYNGTGTHNSTEAFNGAALFKNVNNVIYADQQAGATADVKITNCLAALPANGGICDARGFGASTQTWAATVNVGTDSKNVSVVFDRLTSFNVTITNGSDVLDLYPGSSVRWEGSSQPQNLIGGFIFASNAAIGNVIKLIDQGNFAGFYIGNPTIQGNATMTMTGAGINLLNGLQTGTVDNPTVYKMPGVLMEITQTAGFAVGPLNINNATLDGAGIAGAKPLLIQAVASGGIMGNINFYGGSIDHPGPGGLVDADLEGITGNDCGGVNFYGSQFESANTADIGIKVNNCTNVHIDAPLFTDAINPGTTAVLITGSNSNQINIDNLANFDAWTNTLVNSSESPTLTITAATQARISHYTYNNGAAGTTLWSMWDSSTGRLLTIDSTGVYTPAGTLTAKVASGATAMTTAGISAGTCGSTVTVTATGALTTDTIEVTANASVGANPGVLILQKWLTAGNVNFAYCNPTAGSVTPTAMTINWKVVR